MSERAGETVDERSSLASVGTAVLERLRQAIASGRLRVPIYDTTPLAEFGVREQAETIKTVLGGHRSPACLAILDVALAERAKLTRPTPELVWSGPEDRSGTARDTSVVLRHLFESAKMRIILAGYSFTHGERLLEPLHRAMAERGVEVLFFIDIKQPEAMPHSTKAYVDEKLTAFIRETWPFGAPYPSFYYDKRAPYPGGDGRPYASLHAKCVIVDDEQAFISSANFTERGHERNIEAGVLLKDPLFSEHFARQWLGLIHGGFVEAWTPPAGTESAP